MILFITVIVILIVVLLTRGGTNSDHEQSVQIAVSQRDAYWRQYIAGFKSRVKTDADRALIDRILKGDAVAPGEVKTEVEATSPAAYQTPEATVATQAQDPQSPVVKPHKQLDNALLLLYLGAFLFVASAGLFVAFGGFSGELRAFIVAIVSGLFYLGGLHLHKHNARLKEAGVSFAAIGMAIAPLVGLSIYSYVFDQTYGPAVWFATSIAVFVLYAHAMYNLRSNFVGYLLIFSFVSMLQSTLSIIDAPVYYFIWMMIIAGLILQLISRYVPKIGMHELSTPAYTSSQLIVPVSVFVSFISIGSQGYAQLAVSLLFASAYYGLEALAEEVEDSRISLIQTSHILGLSALAVGSFAFREDVSDVAIGLLIASLIHIILFISTKNNSSALLAVVTNSLIAAMGMVFFALGTSTVLLLSLAVTVLLGWVASIKLGRAEGIVLSTIAVGCIPIVIGLRIISPALDTSSLALLTLAAPLLLAGARWWLLQRQKTELLDVMAIPFVIVTLFSVFPAALTTVSIVSFFVTVALGALFVGFGVVERNSEWSIASGLMMITFVLHALFVGANPVLTLSLLVAVIWNIALALHYREETTRWIGSLFWLCIPWAMSAEGFNFDITSAGYSWLYVGVLAGFLLARAIARGVVARSEKIKLSSYEADASVAYVFGYYAASLFAFIYAVASSAQLVSIITIVLIFVSVLLALFIEKNATIAAAIPVLLQVLVLSVVSPDLSSTPEVTLYLVLSLIVALCCYAMHKLALLPSLTSNLAWLDVSRWTLYIVPASVLFVGRTELMMPIGLAVVGMVALLESRTKPQDQKETAGLIIVGALMWMMWYFGVRNIQAYTHVIAAVFALYAYLRYVNNDEQKGDEYLQSMFLTATVPLVLQALFGTSGDIYGWWLILEQIGFILLGMALGKPFLTKWGLYVSVAAVLYQLRDLGWAALTVLAVVIIGIALYYLGKQDVDKK